MKELLCLLDSFIHVIRVSSSDINSNVGEEIRSERLVTVYNENQNETESDYS